MYNEGKPRKSLELSVRVTRVIASDANRVYAVLSKLKGDRVNREIITMYNEGRPRQSLDLGVPVARVTASHATRG